MVERIRLDVKFFDAVHVGEKDVEDRPAGEGADELERRHRAEAAAHLGWWRLELGLPELMELEVC